MEKRKAHYRLEDIQAQMADVRSLRLSNTARKCVLYDLGWSLEDALKVVRSLTRKDFFKSMTTERNHKVWQDVYHAERGGVVVYLKFQRHDDAYFFTVSFKEK